MSLQQVLRELAACRICRDTPRYLPPLPHEPRPVIQADARARICIAGQAPGARVHASGKPFTDPSGVRLRQWLGVDEATFYDARRLAIVPMGHCFPGLNASGSDLPPRRECAPTWRSRIFADLPNLELIIVLGHHALRWHLRDAGYAGIGDAVRDFRARFAAPGLPKIIALPHPSWRNNSWLKANPWFETEVLPLLRQDVQRLLKDAPPKG